MYIYAVFGIVCMLVGVEPIPTNIPCEKDGLTLQILHTNDMHSRYEQTDAFSSECSESEVSAGQCYGGFARLATLIRRARNSSIPALFLNAGDTYQGNIWHILFTWKIVTKFLNILAPNATSLGNHEFDNGVDGLIPFLENAEFPILCANLDLSLEPKLAETVNLKKSTVFTIQNKKVAVIGYLTRETPTVSHPGKVIFLDEVESIKKEIARLKDDHDDIKIFIALGHSGFSIDKEIAKEIEDIDLVIGGHSNTFLYSGEQPDTEPIVDEYPTVVVQKSGRKVYVVQAYAYTKYLGNLLINFDSDGEIKTITGSPILVDNNVPEASDVLDELNLWKNNISYTLDQIGSTKVHLDGSTICRTFECNMGNLITDALVDYTVKEVPCKKGWTAASIAIYTGGGIRGSIAKRINNAITHRQILEVIPFSNVVFSVELNGTTVLNMLEKSVHDLHEENYNYPPGSFLQLSGIRVTYDLNKKPASRVDPSKVMVLCASCDTPVYKLLDLNSVYTILIPDYMYYGGDGYDMFEGEKFTSLGTTVLDIVMEYLQLYSPVYTAIDGRIKVLTGRT